MSQTWTALLCTLISGLGLIGLAASDPKRRRHSDPPPHLTRYGLTLLVLAPGLWLAVTAQGSGFLLWIGASAVLGWIVAAVINRARPR